jgi:tetratricopeptide (TPR) repeat protein/serine/threonine protein kinase
MKDASPEMLSLFCGALERSSADERAGYLAAACGQDAELRERIEALLRAHEQAGGFLWDKSAVDDPRATVDDPISERPGTVIGPYKLMEQIGEGGMGLVFVAEQQQPVRRKVALKVIKPGMDTRQVVARFEAERQALALMDHPHIAKVFDGGTTDSGRPYFVMELVKGVPITEYCDQNRVPIRQRLELFVSVCQAVQHAHQKGIIHRDLKPSNVLVMSHDGTPVVKVIDFGVAKAIGQQLTDKTIYTQFAQMVGTPLYMSPEQAGMSSLDVDTRSDIYSLGVLLYELLTGTTPFDKERLREAGYDQMRRIICEEEPPKPSMRISTMGKVATTVSTQRQSEPRQLSKLIRGELDWIVMKAVEKDRNRRYDTTNGLAMDVQRYLNDEPVLACPPSAWYRFRKFAQRNKAALAVASLILLFIAVIGGGGGWLVRDRAARQRDAEGRVIEILTVAEPLLREGHPWDPALVSAAQRVELELHSGVLGPKIRRRAEQLRRDMRMLADLDEIRLRQANSKEGAMCDSVGTERRYAAAFLAYGLDVAALEPSQAAARVQDSAIREALVAGLDAWMQVKPVSDRDRTWLQAVADGADNSTWRRAFREAALARDTQKLKALAGQVDVRTQSPSVLSWLGAVLVAAGLPNECGTLLRQAQQLYPEDFWINYNLGHLLIFGPPPHRHDEALGYFRAAVAVHPRSAEARSILGLTLLEQGDVDGAIAAYRQAIALDPKFMLARNGIGVTLARKGQLDEAIAELREAIPIKPDFLDTHIHLGRVLGQKGQLDEAIRAYRTAIELSPKSAALHDELGFTLFQNKQLDEAIRECRTAIALDPKFAPAHCTLGIALRGKRHLDEAVHAFQKAIELDPKFAPAHNGLGFTLHDKKQLEEAIRAYRTAIALDPKFAWPHNNLGVTLKAQTKLDEAIAEYHKAIQLDPKLVAPHINLGNALPAKGKLDEAIAEYRRAIELNPKEVLPHCNLGIALGKHGDTAQAIACYQKAIELDPKYAHAYSNLGICLRDLNRPEEAVANFRKAVELDPKFTHAYYSLAVALHGMNRLEEAVANFRKAVELDPKDYWSRNGLGDTLRDHGKLNEAVKCYRRAIELDPKNVWAYDRVGITLRQQGKRDEAIAFLRRAIDLAPQNARRHNNLGAVLMDQRKYDDAIACFRKAIELDPKDATAHDNLGLALESKGELDEAVASHRRALKLEPKTARIHFNLGCALRRQEKLDEAIASFRKATDIDPTFHRAYYFCGLALCQQNQLDEAIVRFGKAMKLDPKYTSAAHRELGRVFQSRGDIDAAMSHYRKAAERLEPPTNKAMVYVYLAEGYQRHGNLEQAVASYKQAIELDPKNGAFHSGLGAVLQSQGKTGEAIDCYRRAAKITPKSAWAHNLLAWTLVTCADPKFRNATEAVEVARKAIELAPRSGVIWNTLGVAHYRAGDWQASLSALKKSRELRKGGDARDWFFLAMAHWQLGHKTEARTWYDKAIAWMEKKQPNDEELRRFQTEAEQLMKVQRKKD